MVCYPHTLLGVQLPARARCFFGRVALIDGSGLNVPAESFLEALRRAVIWYLKT